MGKRILIILLLCLFIPVFSTSGSINSFDKRVNIHGGVTKTKSMAIWELYKYKYTTLLRKPPLCYAPWKAYLAVDKYVEVTNIDDYNCIVVNEDLSKEVATDATFNRNFAKRFKGKSLYKIYYWLLETEYVKHKKTAREVFEQRKGDCAGMSAALYVICKVNHIPVRYIIGWNKYGCHAWNKVKWKGKWYWVDIAYDKYFSRKLWKGYKVMEEW